MYIDELDNTQEEKEHYDMIDAIMEVEEVDFAGARMVLVERHERVLYLTDGKVTYLEI